MCCSMSVLTLYPEFKGISAASGVLMPLLGLKSRSCSSSRVGSGFVLSCLRSVSSYIMFALGELVSCIGIAGCYEWLLDGCCM